METRLRRQIQAILASDYRGPRASYGEVDVIKALFAIGNSEASVGRFKLGKVTGLGQGEVRTLIARLKDAELITVDSRGCALSEKGRKKFESISRAIPISSPAEAKELNLGKYSWYVVVRDRESGIKKGLEQRDASIRAGATGALTVIYSDGRFKVPSERNPEDCESMGPAEPWTSIRKVAALKNGDVIIVSGADTPLLAEEGALAAALTIL
jgi:predicted transcriptional regulator